MEDLRTRAATVHDRIEVATGRGVPSARHDKTSLTERLSNSRGAG
jgi:hypothetical protein